MSPIGPAPLIRTSSPRTGNASAVWTALPNGSKIAATSGSIPGQWCQMFVIGRATYSAKAPSRPTPRPIVWAHRWRRPARQWRQRPHTTWPSPLTRSPGWKSVTLLPTSTISPTNSWPTTSGGWMVVAAQGSQASMWRSVPQIPVRWTRMRTSLIPIVGRATSRSSSPGPGAGLTRASIGVWRQSRSVSDGVHDRILHPADAFDLDPHAIPGSRKTGGWRKTPTPSGVPVDDDVAGLESDRRAHVLDDRSGCRRRCCRSWLSCIGAGAPRRGRSRGSATTGSAGRAGRRTRRRSRRPARSGRTCPSPSPGAIGRRRARLRERGLDALPVARAHVIADDVAGDVVHRIGRGLTRRARLPMTTPSSASRSRRACRPAGRSARRRR